MTRKGSEVLGACERRVARRLAELRKAAGLTLEEVGAASGLSKSYLSRVENLKTAVNISSLERLAELFVVPVGAFFQQEGGERFCLHRAGEGKPVRLRGRKGINIRLLAHPLDKRMMEPFEVDVHTTPADAPMQSHEGEEFFQVITGTCDLHYGTAVHRLRKGDSVYFDAATPHKVAPVDKRPCRLLAVVTSRDFSFHGNLAKLLNE